MYKILSRIPEDLPKNEQIERIVFLYYIKSVYVQFYTYLLKFIEKKKQKHFNRNKKL